MSMVPSELKYTSSHEWVRAEGDGVYSVGITEHAQELLGDMVYVDLPTVGSTVTSGDDCAVVESVKAASDIYAPLTGEVIAVNDELSEAPGLVNNSPYDEGWLFRIQAADESEVADLLDADGYQSVVLEE